MSAEENKALVRRFYTEIDKGNIDAMDELVAEDYLRSVFTKTESSASLD